ncbi:hypothetical protein QE152_g3916 [Popillia japonica]|uniref:Uncharacterized protein n=1 Tax=Popillia japonica TaxID=7064 RepID=A0AAW1MYW8_POPJA
MRNKNGEKIMELCIEDLVITNTKFKHKDVHKYTRAVAADSRNERSIIDGFLISRQKFKLIKDVRVYRQAEIGSDHYLLRMDIRKEKEHKIKRRIQTRENIKSHTLREDDIKRKYQERLHTKLKENEQEVPLEEKWGRLKKII